MYSFNDEEGKKIKIKKNNSLTQYEKEFINCYGDFFDMRGRSETIGRIFALLSLKARSPEKGLDQQEIASLIDKSVSTVSRTLNKMVKGKMCSYTEELNEKYRKEKKYYIMSSLKEFTLTRFNQSLKDLAFLKRDLEQIKKNIPENESNKNPDLIANIKNLIKLYDKSTLLYEKTIELSKNFLKDLDY